MAGAGAAAPVRRSARNRLPRVAYDPSVEAARPQVASAGALSPPPRATSPDGAGSPHDTGSPLSDVTLPLDVDVDALDEEELRQVRLDSLAQRHAARDAAVAADVAAVAAGEATAAVATGELDADGGADAGSGAPAVGLWVTLPLLPVLTRWPRRISARPWRLTQQHWWSRHYSRTLRTAWAALSQLMLWLLRLRPWLLARLRLQLDTGPRP